MRSQQQSVDRLADRLRGIRDRIAHVEMGQTEVQDELKRIEGRPNTERDPGMVDSYKTRLGYLAQEETRLRDDESQLAAQLQIEQARLAEINDQLDALQRELETPPAENKPPQGGKRP
jgi:predicted  nucleic acid-binding Zn-ribbon protein